MPCASRASSWILFDLRQRPHHHNVHDFPNIMSIHSFLADLCACRHLLFRNHQRGFRPHLLHITAYLQKVRLPVLQVSGSPEPWLSFLPSLLRYSVLWYRIRSVLLACADLHLRAKQFSWFFHFFAGDDLTNLELHFSENHRRWSLLLHRYQPPALPVLPVLPVQLSWLPLFPEFLSDPDAGTGSPVCLLLYFWRIQTELIQFFVRSLFSV